MTKTKRLAIMQPYFLPYIGYWQLMANVDEFVVYDDIEFTKKGWIHRNRYLSRGKDRMFTLPLKKDSDFLDVRERSLSDSWPMERVKLHRKWKEAYQKAPHFQEIAPLVEECLFHDSDNLFDFVLNSINQISQSLHIDTKLTVSSQLGDTRGFKGQDRVLEICELLEASEYVNLSGGKGLYKKEDFGRQGVGLHFHHVDEIVYTQFGEAFIPNLSIIDVLMFNGIEKTGKLLSCCKIHD